LSVRCVTAAVAAFLIVSAPVSAKECANPHALGTSRVVTLDPAQFRHIGKMQYGRPAEFARSLPLAHHEIVLTFDDGPMPPSTEHVLQALAAECVKATFFMIGSQARAYPDLARRVFDAGHIVGTHTQNHPYRFDLIDPSRAEHEIDDGIASVAAALGETRPLAPFLRFPGLRHTDRLDRYIAAKGMTAWSADFAADDWRGIDSATIVRRAMRNIERNGRGILLLHDIHGVTAAALPALLRELKTRGYRIVQVVPAINEPMIAAAKPAETPAAVPASAEQPVVVRATTREPMDGPDSWNLRLNSLPPDNLQRSEPDTQDETPAP
jgi:peptidoglycan/xylan/chitin deacetylase (PgdA/CDA1 family)